MWAVKCKNTELMELYSAKGCEITAEDVNGDNALIYAAKSTFWDEETVTEYHRAQREYFDINYKNKVNYSY